MSPSAKLITPTAPAQKPGLSRQPTLIKNLPPKIEMPPPPKIIKTPAPPDNPKTAPGKQGSLEDSQGNQMELNVAGKDLYRNARRLSEAIRSRSPSPASGKRETKPESKVTPTPAQSKNEPVVVASNKAGSKPQQPKQQGSTEDSKGNKMDLNTAGKDLYASARRLSDAISRSRSPSPTPGQGSGRNSRDRKTAPSASSTTPAPKVTLVRQATLAELPDKLAGIMNRPAGQTVNIVQVPAVEVNNTLGNSVGKAENVICIVPDDNGNGNDEDGEEDNGKESFLINVKMKQGQQQENGGFKRTINGIAVGISRLPKNQALRKKIRESKIAVVTADVLTDIGCGGFADKQKQLLSQACSVM